MSDPVYLNICWATQGFNIRANDDRRGKPYPGAVVVSRDTFYFAVCRELIAAGASAAGAPLFGALDGVLAKSMGTENRTFLPQPASGVQEVNLTDLPEEIVDHPDWPVKFHEGPVIVVPREAVQSLRTAFLLGGFEVKLDTATIVVMSPFLQRKKLAAAMVRMGWDVQGI